MKQSGVKNVIEKAGSIVKRLRNSSVAMAAFYKCQDANNLSWKVLLSDTDTRWCSTYDMLERLLVNSK